MLVFHYLVWLWEFFDAYYSYTDTIIDPDMADYFIEIAYEDLPDVRECIDKCEYSNENMSYIISNGNKIFRCDAMGKYFK